MIKLVDDGEARSVEYPYVKLFIRQFHSPPVIPYRLSIGINVVVGCRHVAGILESNRPAPDDRELSIHKGSFFECRGGWVREGANDDSTMIVMHKA